MYLVLARLFLLIDNPGQIDNSEQIIELIMQQTAQALIGMSILLVAIVIVMIIASKIGMEDFDYIDYVVMTLGIFIATIVLYVVLVMLIGAIFKNEIQIDIRVFTFFFSIIFLPGPILLSLKSSFMFMKPRVILTAVYTFMIATTVSIIILT